MQWFDILMPVSMILTALGLLIVLRRARTLARAQAALCAENKLLREDVAALTAGGVGVSEHIRRLEKRLRCLTEKQESLESTHERDRPYGRAIQMVHNGAGIDELVDNCGMTRNEAELIVMLHQVDVAV